MTGKNNNREWAVPCLIGLHCAIISIFLSRQEKAGPVPTTVHKPLSRAILQKIQRARRADGSHPRAPPPLASPVVFYCRPQVFSSLTFFSPIFSHLTPPRIYILPRRLGSTFPSSRPLLYVPPGASFRGRCPSGGKACYSLSLSLSLVIGFLVWVRVCELESPVLFGRVGERGLLPIFDLPVLTVPPLPTMSFFCMQRTRKSSVFTHCSHTVHHCSV